ncbi:MAG: hypothetical protein H7174_06905 [Flavobacterium sp.]|nr:hypothetical protein [Flavobacterium sp.]
MKINLKTGIDQLIFGMKQKDVLSFYGMPDKKIDDEDGNKIFIYNDLKLHLNFYEEEDFKLGYIISANDDLILFDKKVIGQNPENIKKELSSIKTWDKEEFDLADNYFNEDNWLILVSEFNKIVKIELGCIINNDEFEWKF